jgi:nuclear pore complex protein Nup53
VQIANKMGLQKESPLINGYEKYFLFFRTSLPETSHCEIDVHNTWVTIFGFPPSAASFILSQFSHYGSILEKKMPAKGIWMHVHYQTKLECRKALSNNGKVFGGTIMIGVMLCKDQVIRIKSWCT